MLLFQETMEGFALFDCFLFIVCALDVRDAGPVRFLLGNEETDDRLRDFAG